MDAEHPSLPGRRFYCGGSCDLRLHDLQFSGELCTNTTISRHSVPKQPISIDRMISKGSPSAKVVMVEYQDFQCDACGRFSTEVLPRLVTDYIDKGTLELRFQHFPLKSIHPFAIKAAFAATCAEKQSRFWQMHDLLFETESLIDETHLSEWATTVGVNGSQFKECLNGLTSSEIDDGMRVASALGIHSTPSFLIGHRLPDGRLAVTKTIRGARRYEDLSERLTAF